MNLGFNELLFDRIASIRHTSVARQIQLVVGVSEIAVNAPDAESQIKPSFLSQAWPSAGIN